MKARLGAVDDFESLVLLHRQVHKQRTEVERGEELIIKRTGMKSRDHNSIQIDADCVTYV